MRRPLLVFLLVQSALIFLIYHSVIPWVSLDRKSLLAEHENEVITAEGTVKKVQIKSYYTAVILDTGSEKTLVRITGIEDESFVYGLVGKKITVQGTVSLPEGRRNPRCFDYRLYLKGQGIYTILKVSKYRIEEGGTVLPLTHFLSVKKAEFYADARELLGEENFSILAGLMFGDKSYLDDELYEEFQTNGTAHVLAVSGLHVGLLYAIVLKLFRGRRNLLQSILTLIILYCYAALSGFSVPVLRASFMISANILAFHLNRRYDMVNTASLCASVFLLINPYQLFDSGFQLSFAAAYTMGVALPWAENRAVKYADRYRSERLYKTLKFVLPLIMIQLGMTPLTIYHFLNYSFISILINPIVIFIASLLLPAGLALFAVSFAASGILLAAAASPANLFCTLLKSINDFASGLKMSSSCPAPPLQYLFLYYAVFFWFFSDTRHILNRMKKEKILAACTAACIAFFLIAPKGYSLPDVTFVDVGQGDCTHIRIGSYNILIDGGGNYLKNIGKDTLKPYLLKNGITHIDLAIITHEDMDHSKGIYELAECFDVREIYTAGTTNADCGIIKIELNGIKYLFMADADTEREQLLIARGEDLSCDVLKTGHHGSSTSTSPELIDAAKPIFASISCGKNNSYGHPSDRVIALFENSGIIYGRTDLYGAWCIYASGSGGELWAVNAAKEKIWHIRRGNQIQNTLPEP